MLTIRTPKNQRRILRTLSAGLSIAEACREAGIGRQAFYRWRKGSKVMTKKVADAIEDGRDCLRDEMRRRAVDGCKEAVYYEGKIVGHRKKYSDTLLKNLAEARLPEHKPKQEIDLSGSVDLTGAADRLESKLAGIAAKLNAGADE